jgi:hypothetical protein
MNSASQSLSERRVANIRPAILLLLLFGLAGCAHYSQNDRLTHYDLEGGYHFNSLTNAENSESLQVVLAFSGGMRALHGGNGS